MAERSEESATSNSLVKETVSTTETTEIETMTNGNQNDKPIVVENSSQVVQSDFTESSATSESNDQMNAITNGMSTVNIDKQPSNVTQPESQKEDVDSENHEPLDPIVSQLCQYKIHLRFFPKNAIKTLLLLFVCRAVVTMIWTVKSMWL